MTRPALSSTPRSRLALTALALLAVFAVLVAQGAGLLWGLKAAGLTGTPPPSATLIKTLLDTLASNWLWLVGTGVGLVLLLLGGMLAFGSR